MLNKIKFKIYKSYKDWQELKLKPLTILFGKNSSGKSSLTKLLTLLEGALYGEFAQAFQLNNNGVKVGSEYRDLVYGRQEGEVLEFKLSSEHSEFLVKITAKIGSNEIPIIINWNIDDEIDLVYNDLNNSYFDNVSKEEYKCWFEGFNLESLQNLKTNDSRTPFSLKDFKIRTSYFGPFREVPDTSYTESQFQKTNQFGISGENAYYFLIKDSQTHEKKLLQDVSNWYKENFEGWGLEVFKDIQRPNYSIELVKEFPKLNINITNVGQGMSQVLPLIVRANYIAEKPTTIIIEQPELHLHPGAHGNLAELFAKSLLDKNKRYLIETHSQNFILRIRRLIAEGKFNKNDLALYWIDFDEEKNVSNLIEIIVDDLGRVDNWPDYIFKDTLDEASALRTAQIEKKDAN